MTEELIALELIEPNPYQPRTVDDPEHIEKLARSIVVDGLLQTPKARRCSDGTYQLAATVNVNKPVTPLGEPATPAATTLTNPAGFNGAPLVSVGGGSLDANSAVTIDGPGIGTRRINQRNQRLADVAADLGLQTRVL